MYISHTHKWKPLGIELNTGLKNLFSNKDLTIHFSVIECQQQ